MKYTYTHGAFTLVEVIVSISIMSVILVAIMSVFFSMNDVSRKTDIQRQLQLNIKNMTQSMSEDIRKNGIMLSGCSVLGGDEGSFWCSNGGNKYYLGKPNGVGGFTVASQDECSQITSTCYMLKNSVPMTNSFVTIQSASFTVLGDSENPRLVMNFVIQPSLKKGVPAHLIKNNTLTIQTTLSESFLKQ